MNNKTKKTEEENLATFGVENLDSIKTKHSPKVKLMTKEEIKKQAPRQVPTFFSSQRD